MKALFLLSAIAVTTWAQPVTVYSEFARIDPKTGNAIAPESPREILSPAVVRNGFTSFQVVVQAAAEDKWWLFVSQNPENNFKLTMYKENGDALERVDLPVQSEGTQVFWLDVWTDANAIVRRVKLEPELSLHDDWVIYPIEARVVDATVPEKLTLAPANPVEAMRGFLCGLRIPVSPIQERVSMSSFRLRNARQDLGLAASASKAELKDLFGDCGAPPLQDLEWYLRIRDYLFRLR